MNAAEFWDCIDKNVPAGECWIWTKAKDSRGYGRVRFEGRAVLAHRLAFKLANGELGASDCVCHSCDTPSCCNPTHLFLGSKADNNQDMMSKGRHGSVVSPGYHKKGEDHGCAKLTNEKAREIAARYGKGGISQRCLAAQYGVSQRTVAKIVLGIGWQSAINKEAADIR